jgi:DNA-directed RNA polymerase subunit M/transcription elongation factor TFIIS
MPPIPMMNAHRRRRAGRTSVAPAAAWSASSSTRPVGGNGFAAANAGTPGRCRDGNREACVGCRTDRALSRAVPSPSRDTMPPDNNVGPPCPMCHSTETERLPFTSDAVEAPVYSCVECGHVWRLAQPARERDRRTGPRNGGCSSSPVSPRRAPHRSPDGHGYKYFKCTGCEHQWEPRVA